MRNQVAPTSQEKQETPALTIRQRRLYDFLDDQSVGVLSSVTPDGNPHGVVIYFSIGKNFVISFLTKAGTHKYANILQHDQVALTVFETGSQSTVQIYGRAVPVTNPDRINALAGTILEVSERKSSALPPIAKLEVGECVAFDIVPSSIHMAAYSSPSACYSEIFDSVESFELEDIDSHSPISRQD